MRTLLQNYSANRPREPRRSGTPEHAPGLALRSGRGAKNKIFLHCVPPPHQTTEPSRSWLRVGGSKPRFVLFNANQPGIEAGRQGGMVVVRHECRGGQAKIELRRKQGQGRFVSSRPLSPPACCLLFASCCCVACCYLYDFRPRAACCL